jgi:hypothetical protein
MAKKRKKQKKEEEEEKYEFVPPEFDEKQFLRDEMAATKQILLVVGYGVFMGTLAAVATIVAGSGYLGLALLLLGFVTMKYMFTVMSVDFTKITKKSWAGNIAFFFFTFLAIWILMVNPPFTDMASPEVKNVRLAVAVGAGVVIHYNYTFNYTSNAYEWHTGKHNMSVTNALKAAYASGLPVNLTAHIADNDRIVGIPTITFKPDTPTVVPVPMSQAASYSYYCYIPSFGNSNLKDGHSFSFQINAEDPAHHITIFTMADYSVQSIA